MTKKILTTTACFALFFAAGALPARSPLRVVVTASHHHVLPYWYRAARRGELPRGGLTVVHLDAHPDMAVPARPLPAGFPARDDAHQDRIDIASFQLAGARAGLVRRVLWVRPVWSPQIPAGEHRFSIGAGNDGLLRVDSPLDYYVLNGVWAPTNQLREPHEVELRVLSLDPPGAANANGSPADETAPLAHSTGHGADLLVPEEVPYVLDIDLDIFSTRNPAVDRLREVGFSEIEIETIRTVFARENLDLSKDPAERQDDLKEIEAAILLVTSGAWYEIPGAAATLWWHGVSLGELAGLYSLLDGKTNQQLDALLVQGRTVVGVPVHRSERKEIQAALEAFEHLTTKRLGRPALVTIARSMKDGFTHPYWLAPVETGVLEILERTLGPVRVSYDADLKKLE